MVTRTSERIEIDEILVAFTLLLLSSGWVGWLRLARRNRELKRLAENHRLLFENAGDAILILRPEDEVVVAANRRAGQLYGCSQETLLGKSMADLGVEPERGRRQVEATVSANGHLYRFTTLQRRFDGEVREIEIRAVTIVHGGQPAILSLNRDITDQATHDASSQDLWDAVVVAQAAAGVAHDVNNLLTVLEGALEMVRLEGDLSAEGLQELGVARETARRCAALLRQLRSQVPRRDEVSKQTDLSHLTESLGEILRRLLPPDVDLELHLEADLPRVLVNPVEFQQVLVNLALNGAEAMAEGGSLTISTEALREEENGSKVRLTILDEGVGMTDEELDRAFEMYFTTKADQGGTGVGLALVRRIVSQWGGTLSVETSVEKGTRFMIDLPGA